MLCDLQICHETCRPLPDWILISSWISHFLSNPWRSIWSIIFDDLPSGELTFCHGKSPFLMGTSTISMAIFHCYVSSPEGIHILAGWTWLQAPSLVLPLFGRCAAHLPAVPLASTLAVVALNDTLSLEEFIGSQWGSHRHRLFTPVGFTRVSTC